MSRNNRPLFNRMCQALRDHNVEFKPFHSFKLTKDLGPAVWEYIDNPVATQRRTGNLLEELAQDVVPQLSFAVRFQLEVCISQGFLNEHSLTQGFVARLIACLSTLQIRRSGYGSPCKSSPSMSSRVRLLVQGSPIIVHLYGQLQSRLLQSISTLPLSIRRTESSGSTLNMRTAFFAYDLPMKSLK